MPERPGTRYAKAPDGTSIAYQVVGDGPVDLVYASGIWSNLDLTWTSPRGLGSSSGSPRSRG